MSFNVGLVVAVKRSLSGGGVFSLTHIDGPSHHTGRGIHGGGTAPLDIYNSWSTPLPYPVDDKFDVSGAVVLPFLWDAAAVPLTGATPTGHVTTRFQYRTKIGGANVSSSGQLLWFSNIADIRSMSTHFSMPALPPGRLADILAKAENQARMLYAVINSLSRVAIASLVLV